MLSYSSKRPGILRVLRVLVVPQALDCSMSHEVFEIAWVSRIFSSRSYFNQSNRSLSKRRVKCTGMKGRYILHSPFSEFSLQSFYHITALVDREPDAHYVYRLLILSVSTSYTYILPLTAIPIIIPGRHKFRLSRTSTMVSTIFSLLPIIFFATFATSAPTPQDTAIDPTQYPCKAACQQQFNQCNTDSAANNNVIGPGW